MEGRCRRPRFSLTRSCTHPPAIVTPRRRTTQNTHKHHQKKTKDRLMSTIKRMMEKVPKMIPVKCEKAFQMALVQLQVTKDKRVNLEKARRLVVQAGREGADVVVLPECFNSPYGTEYFREYSEESGGVVDEWIERFGKVGSEEKTPVMEPGRIGTSETMEALRGMAREAGVTLVGGTFPERVGDGCASDKSDKSDKSDNKIYNTCTVWGRGGELLGAHRKAHLFDVDVPGGIRFKESQVVSAGARVTHVDTAHGRLGVMICYDVRFAEMTMVMGRRGCVAVVVPGAFNGTTGPQHWELLLRARAVDSQVYVAGCSPAPGAGGGGYAAWGHSLVAGPMGGVVVGAGESRDAVVAAAVDPRAVAAARAAIPVGKQRRFDLYQDVRLID